MNISSKSEIMDKQTDETLAILAKEGSDDALTSLIQRYVPLVILRVRTYAKSGLDEDDLFQEGMIALLKAVRSYRDCFKGSFKTFAVVCINNKLNSAIRAHMRDKNAPMREYLSLSDSNVTEEQLADSSVQNNPEFRVIENEEVDACNRCIDNFLSQFEQQVLRLFLSSYSYEEMARHLESSTKAVDNALQRVRRKLKNVFDFE